MKTTLMALVLGVSFSAQASVIAKSDLNPVQQAIVVQAIQDACGHTFDIEQTAPTVVRYDYQEVGDTFYTIQLTGIQSIDQGIRDLYDITVEAVVPAVHSAPLQFVVEKGKVSCVMR